MPSSKKVGPLGASGGGALSIRLGGVGSVCHQWLLERVDQKPEGEYQDSVVGQNEANHAEAFPKSQLYSYQQECSVQPNIVGLIPSLGPLDTLSE